MKSIAYRLLILVTFVVTMHGVLHSHALAESSGEYTAAAAQNCALCVSSSTSLPHAATEPAEPDFTAFVVLPLHLPSPNQILDGGLPPRGPPQV